MIELVTRDWLLKRRWILTAIETLFTASPRTSPWRALVAALTSRQNSHDCTVMTLARAIGLLVQEVYSGSAHDTHNAGGVKAHWIGDGNHDCVR